MIFVAYEYVLLGLLEISSDFFSLVAGCFSARVKNNVLFSVLWMMAFKIEVFVAVCCFIKLSVCTFPDCKRITNTSKKGSLWMFSPFFVHVDPSFIVNLTPVWRLFNAS